MNVTRCWCTTLGNWLSLLMEYNLYMIYKKDVFWIYFFWFLLISFDFFLNCEQKHCLSLTMMLILNQHTNIDCYWLSTLQYLHSICIHINCVLNLFKWRFKRNYGGKIKSKFLAVKLHKYKIVENQSQNYWMAAQRDRPIFMSAANDIQNWNAAFKL